MKKAILLAVALSIGSTPAFANALFHSWDNCAGEAGASNHHVFSCGDVSVSSSIMTYQLDAQTPGIVTVSGAVDITVVGSPDLPPYWHCEPGGCNEFGLGINDARAGTPCSNAGGLPSFSGTSGGNANEFITAYEPGVGGPNKARILWTVKRSVSNPLTLSTGRYFAARLVWFSDNSVGTGLGNDCVGCDAAVVLTLSSITAEREDGVGASILGTDPGSQASICLNGANCDVVGVKNRTWGLLKSLYR